MVKKNTRSSNKGERRGSLVTPNTDIEIVHPSDDHSKFSVVRQQHADLSKASIKSWQELKEDCQTIEDIHKTVRRLPLDNVRPLLQELLAQFDVQQARDIELTEWIKAVLLTHTAYFMSLPDVVQRLSSLYKELGERLTVYPKLLAMRGRLDLIQRQIDAHTNKDDIELDEDEESDTGLQADSDSDNDFDDDEEEEEAVEDDDDDLMEMDTEENAMFKEEDAAGSDDDEDDISDASDLEE